MKTIKNDRASFRTRAVIGGSKTGVATEKSRELNRQDFRVDERGYFSWGDDKKSGTRKEPASC